MYVWICFIGFMCWWDFIFELLGIPLLLDSIVIYTSRSECEPSDLYEKGERPLLRNFGSLLYSFFHSFVISLLYILWCGLNNPRISFSFLSISFISLLPFIFPYLISFFFFSSHSMSDLDLAFPSCLYSSSWCLKCSFLYHHCFM